MQAAAYIIIQFILLTAEYDVMSISTLKILIECPYLHIDITLKNTNIIIQDTEMLTCLYKNIWNISTAAQT